MGGRNKEDRKNGKITVYTWMERNIEMGRGEIAEKRRKRNHR